MRSAFVFLILIFFHIQIAAQVFQVTQLAAVINQTKKDSVQKTERLASLKFHKLINDYRKKNKLDTLAWDDVLWLAARNHSVWMGTNNVLSHSEREGTKNFTGADPGGRYAYASAHSSDDWSGENALYNWSDDGETIEEISDEIASESFTQWKNSPGHDENMRAKSSRSHAVAFYLEPQGPVWATDLFSYQSPSGNELAPTDNSVVNFELVKGSTEKKKIVKRMSVIELEQTRSKLLEMIKSNSAVPENKAMEKAAMNHARYMANLKTLTHNENKYHPGFYGETEMKRMMKASLGLYFFSQNKIQLSESIASVKTEIEDLDISELVSAITSDLDSNAKIKGNPVSAGYGISIIQIKTQLKIYAVRLEGVKASCPDRDELADK